MPLARILTFDPGDAADFARQLQQLGFEVEIADPNEELLAPADLEIEFAICDQQQVLGRVSAIAAQLQSDVVVFPGAIPPLPRAISPVPEAGGFVADFSRNQRFEPREMPAELTEPINEPAIEEAPESVQLLEAAEQSSEVNHAPAQEEAFAQTPSAFSQWSERLRHGSDRMKISLASGLARLKTTTSSAGSALARQGRRLQEGMKQRIAQARAAREHHLAELKKRREEVEERQQQRQAESATAPLRQEQEMPGVPLTLAQQEELQRAQVEKERLIAEVERLRVEAARQAAALEQARLAAETLHQQQPLTPAARTPNRLVKAVRGRSGHLRGALAGAVAASFLFLVGMVLANFQAIIPVSHTLNNGSVEQQVPFGATTIHGAPGVTVGGVTAGGATSAAKPAGGANASQQQPVQQPKPQPAMSSPPVAKQKSQWHRFQQRSSSEDDATADDVTITHFGLPKKPSKPVQQQARLKRYSDE